MKCAECNLCGYNEDGFPCCLADPRWPAPCEYEDDYEEEEEDPFNENDPYVLTDPMAFY